MSGVAARLHDVVRRNSMRATASVHVTVTRFRVWRAAVAALLALVWAVVVAWVVSHALARGGPPPVAVVAVAVAALLVVSWFAWRLAEVRPFALHWDGRCWFLSPSTAPFAAVDPVAGDVVVMIDLGSWLLLRFVAERRVGTVAPTWLPLQRRGLERSWHAVRCAVHAPPQAPAAADAAVE